MEFFLFYLDLFCLKDPEAAFLGLAKFSFNFSKSEFFIKTSPLISISVGIFLPFNIFGISEIVFRFSVISSPSTPSPLERPWMNLPFCNIKMQKFRQS